mmetsp:Transcript_31071/g.46889  ORF Transcript_31071/g.46889 Transcript_31071/m.46889 type:complete len:233 (-) Transcript_31071:83-781(-)
MLQHAFHPHAELHTSCWCGHQLPRTLQEEIVALWPREVQHRAVDGLRIPVGEHLMQHLRVLRSQPLSHHGCKREASGSLSTLRQEFCTLATSACCGSILASATTVLLVWRIVGSYCCLRGGSLPRLPPCYSSLKGPEHRWTAGSLFLLGQFGCHGWRKSTLFGFLHQDRFAIFIQLFGQFCLQSSKACAGVIPLLFLCHYGFCRFLGLRGCHGRWGREELVLDAVIQVCMGS